MAVAVEDEDASDSCAVWRREALDCRFERTVDECRDSAADVRRDGAGLGGAGRDEVRDSRFGFVRADAGSVAAVESESGGGSGSVICVVGVFSWKTLFGVGVAGEDRVVATERAGWGIEGVVGVDSPFVRVMSLKPRAMLLVDEEDDGRDANSCAPRRGGG